jgi:hypothetical protein
VTDPPATPLHLARRLGLDAAGLGLLGAMAASRYDGLVPAAWRSLALLPGARSALVVASGGRALFAAYRASPEAALAADPLDAYTRRVVEAAADRLGGRSRALFAFERRGGAYADFVALGQAAGLGAPGRLGLLLHPEFGPWVSIRAVLLTDRTLAATGPIPGFAPCTGCPAPCVSACRGGAVASGSGRFDVAACRGTRAVEPACRLRCDARHACVIGADHAYDAEAEAHHMRASLGT